MADFKSNRELGIHSKWGERNGNGDLWAVVTLGKFIDHILQSIEYVDNTLLNW